MTVQTLISQIRGEFGATRNPVGLNAVHSTLFQSNIHTQTRTLGTFILSGSKLEGLLKETVFGQSEKRTEGARQKKKQCLQVPAIKDISVKQNTTR